MKSGRMADLMIAGAILFDSRQQYPF